MAANLTITDALIVGGGHAGLSAALTLYRGLHTCIVFDTHQPRNKWDTPVHIMPTWDDQKAEEKRKISREELLKSGLIRFVDFGIEEVSKTGNGLFRVVDTRGEAWLGRKLLLSIGSTNLFPSIGGYEENFARGIFPCMLQFGYELRGVSSAGLLAVDTLASVPHASMLAQDAYKFTDNMTVYTSANPELAHAMQNELGSYGIAVDDREIIRLMPGPSKADVTIKFQDGAEKTEGFLVHRPGTRVASKLASQLGLEITEFGDIRVSPPFCQTNIPGVYAAGDCASPMKIIPNAISMGAYAGAGIARELPRAVTGNAAC